MNWEMFDNVCLLVIFFELMGIFSGNIAILAQH